MNVVIPTENSSPSFGGYLSAIKVDDFNEVAVTELQWSSNLKHEFCKIQLLTLTHHLKS